MRLWRLGVAGGGVGALLLSFGFTYLPTTASATSATAHSPGYWLAGADGGVYSFNAPFYGSGYTGSGPGACSFTPQAPSTFNGALGCDAFTSTPTGSG